MIDSYYKAQDRGDKLTQNDIANQIAIGQLTGYFQGSPTLNNRASVSSTSSNEPTGPSKNESSTNLYNTQHELRSLKEFWSTAEQPMTRETALGMANMNGKMVDYLTESDYNKFMAWINKEFPY